MQRPQRFFAGLALGLVPCLSLLTAAPQGTTTSGLIITAEQQEILSHMSIVYLDDGQGGTAKTIRVTGTNLQIVNGLDATETLNGLGNLIVGYLAPRGAAEYTDRTGSHNVVGGRKANYSSYGGLVVGWKNSSRAPYASVVGASASTAAGWASVIVGGHSNRADGGNASVLGGSVNEADGQFSVVCGGRQRDAVGELEVVTGNLAVKVLEITGGSQ